MAYKVKILKIGKITHDVKRFTVEKPEGFKFIPGQASLVSVNQGTWKFETRPFTFTSLNEDKNLEFTIKRYKEHKGVSDRIHNLKEGNELIIREAFGTINYKGKGVFIAGGAGITPFIAILRQLKKQGKLNENKMIFSNKKKEDIIIEEELKEMFMKNPENLTLTLTREKKENKKGKDNYEYRRIDEDFLKEKIKDFNQNFYICGPIRFVKDIRKILKKFGAKPESLIFER